MSIHFKLLETVPLIATHHTLQMSLHYLVKNLCQKIAIILNIMVINDKSQGSVATDLKCAGYVLLQTFRYVC